MDPKLAFNFSISKKGKAWHLHTWFVFGNEVSTAGWSLGMFFFSTSVKSKKTDLFTENLQGVGCWFSVLCRSFNLPWEDPYIEGREMEVQ